MRLDMFRPRDPRGRIQAPAARQFKWAALQLLHARGESRARPLAERERFGWNSWIGTIKRVPGQYDADLATADLSRTNLHGARLTNVDLNRANLIGARLYQAVLPDANPIKLRIVFRSVVVEMLARGRHVLPFDAGDFACDELVVLADRRSRPIRLSSVSLDVSILSRASAPD